MTKSKKQLQTIDEYIARFPEEIHVLGFRFAIRESAPKAEEKISYGILRSGSTVGALGKNRSGFSVHIQALKHPKKNWLHLNKKNVYPIPIPYDLMKKIVRYEITENFGKGEINEKAYCPVFHLP
jgi:hypothetical protein